MLYNTPQYSVLVVSSSQKAMEYIVGALTAEVFTPVTQAKSAGEARRLLISQQFDITVINSPLKDESGLELAHDLSDNSAAGIILFPRAEDYEQMSFRTEQYGVITVPKPLNRAAVLQSLHLAAATRERMRRVEKRNIKLQGKMDEIKIVNRAKWTLIEHMKMSEPQAHKYIEKQAMDFRISKCEAAENIIKIYEE